MDIKRAKKEIKDSVKAYLLKDEDGGYLIPSIRQRPILLMGPPGIGKTQIMEQIAKECKIGLVAYTITHHTRQSAIGLPFIREKIYGGRTYSVTEYTMSEIIGSVYENIEETGIKEGILFIDEINCVSETLAPAMLQFLQCKTFGNQAVPQGWVIVAAGNPPEYNRSVRDFDMVTLDRIRKIDIEENYEVWREYAYQAEIHPAIMAYLEIRREYFYRMETTVDGKAFATARGWEDLSEFLKACEVLGKQADREVVHQYIQHWKIAKDFANYLELYEKYKRDYGLLRILEGRYEGETVKQLRSAPFDERLSVVNMLIGKLSGMFRDRFMEERYVELLHGYLLRYKECMEFDTVIREASEKYGNLRKARHLTRAEDGVWRKVLSALERNGQEVKKEHLSGWEAFARVKEMFGQETELREQKIDGTLDALEHVFDFMEEAFGDSQEMVAFVTELNTDYYSVQFLKDNDCERYCRYNKKLLFGERQEEILKELDEVEQELNTALKS